MIKYSFTKMNGAGNDFIMIDRDANPPLELTGSLISRLCDRHFGIGADGVIAVSKSQFADFAMEYYNADGSSGSLCGNGARCAVSFAVLCGKTANNSVHFLCNAARFSANLLEADIVRFFLHDPTEIRTDFELAGTEYILTAHSVNTGSPHLVVFIEDIRLKNRPGSPAFAAIDDIPVNSLGMELRYHALFPDGINVNFIEIKDGKVFIRTYERGVENETLACGTGSTAAAVICGIVKGFTPPIALNTRSNRVLTVDFSRNNLNISAVSLTGPADVSFNGFFEN